MYQKTPKHDEQKPILQDNKIIGFRLFRYEYSNILFWKVKRLKFIGYEWLERPINDVKEKRKIGNYTVIYILLLTLLIPTVANAQTYSNAVLVDSIFISEGAYQAQYLYGIVSIPYETEEQARRYCMNTVRNQRKRHAAHDCGFTYLECLAKRYCPVRAANDPQGLNKHWLSNVKHWANRPEIDRINRIAKSAQIAKRSV